MPKWTQDEAIAFECARECIGHLMALCTDELHHGNPTPERLAELEATSRRLAAERRTLHVDDHAEVARVRAEYGALVRAWTRRLSGPDPYRSRPADDGGQYLLMPRDEHLAQPIPEDAPRVVMPPLPS